MRRTIGILGVVMSILVFASAFVPVAQASAPQGITIQMSKPLGPANGTFTASGAIADSGTVVTLSRTLGALPSRSCWSTTSRSASRGGTGRSLSGLTCRRRQPPTPMSLPAKEPGPLLTELAPTRSSAEVARSSGR